MDLVECKCCHQMLTRKNITILNSANQNQNVLKQLLSMEKISLPISVCKTYCLTSIKNNEIPKFSILNNMYLNDIPDQISCLNNYELLLIQLAKCFHTIYRLNSVTSFKNKEKVFGFKGNKFFE